MTLNIVPILIILVISVAIVGLFLWVVPIGIWIQARFSGVKLGLLQLVFMRIRKVPPMLITSNLIMTAKADCPISAAELESYYLAGVNITDVCNAVIAARKANIELEFGKAAAMDRAGRKVFEAVTMSVKPKVIETPKIAAVAKDGIQVIAMARVTVRTNIAKLVGGAGEDTVLARVGEGVVSTIGSSNTHKEVLENPDRISKTVLSKGLDQGTAFEILSIDIADVDIGSNIGAALQTDQAEADKKIAQAKAEERKAMAQAREHEMLALKEEMRARLVEAEQKIPLAFAEALKSGNLGAMDYNRFQNIQADTEMRRSVSLDERKSSDNNDDK